MTGALWKRLLLRVTVVSLLALVVFKFVLVPIRMPPHHVHVPSERWGWSFIDRATYAFREPQRGDVVAIRMAGQTLVHLKRIVAMPGEEVLILRGQVYVNSQLLEEPYVVAPYPWNYRDVPVAQDEYFVISDFRNMPLDHAVVGRVKRDRIIGRILF